MHILSIGLQEFLAKRLHFSMLKTSRTQITKRSIGCRCPQEQLRAFLNEKMKNPVVSGGNRASQCRLFRAAGITPSQHARLEDKADTDPRHQLRPAGNCFSSLTFT